MKTAAQTTFAERLGRTLGRAWRSCARLIGGRRAGCSRGMGAWHCQATALLAVKLAAIGVLLYTAFWLALLRVRAGRRLGSPQRRWDDEEHKPEWRYGPAGSASTPATTTGSTPTIQKTSKPRGVTSLLS